MNLELIKRQELDFVPAGAPEAYHSVRIWNCKYRTLKALGAFTNLRVLEILSFPDESFDMLRQMTSLETLQIVHLPKVTSITPLASLKALKKLSLATLPSWDPSGRTTSLESLEPLTTLTELTDLELLGVRATTGGVESIMRCPSLTMLRVSKWSKADLQRLRARFEI